MTLQAWEGEEPTWEPREATWEPPKSKMESCDLSEGKRPPCPLIQTHLEGTGIPDPSSQSQKAEIAPLPPTRKPLPCPTSGRQLLGIDDFGCILMAGTELDTASDHRESPPGKDVEQEIDTRREREREPINLQRHLEPSFCQALGTWPVTKGGLCPSHTVLGHPTWHQQDRARQTLLGL